MCDFGYCIRGEYVCDTKTDCLDGSDEWSCDYRAKICTDEQFQCHTHEPGVPFRRACFPLDAVCDGAEDCADGSDEWNCTYTTCPDNFFSCDGKCYFHQMWCDGRLQCVDGLDEAECNNFMCKPGLVRYEFIHRFLVRLVLNVVTNFVKGEKNRNMQALIATCRH